ncbi:hypothetical protein HNY73_000097 [Argiope bruennichi]|uniref:Uncharacterized protein n=1 Tax=Argiope bruennichi TaxID=94029 RepID=A0A8T0FXX2_ARGBR|nr:hypothetical protein HNY73_000097 [Argiope bruennichi]
MWTELCLACQNVDWTLSCLPKCGLDSVLPAKMWTVTLVLACQNVDWTLSCLPKCGLNSVLPAKMWTELCLACQNVD